MTDAAHLVAAMGRFSVHAPPTGRLQQALTGQRDAYYSARRPALPGRLRTACVHASSSLSPEALYEALKGVRHASSRLSPEAMDEAIKEMNADMPDEVRLLEQRLQWRVALKLAGE